MEDLADAIPSLLSGLEDLVRKLRAFGDSGGCRTSLEAAEQLIVALQNDFPSKGEHLSVHQGLKRAINMELMTTLVFDFLNGYN